MSVGAPATLLLARGGGARAGSPVELIVACLVLFVFGVSHYRGHNRAFLRFLPGRWMETMWFGMAWLGVGGVLVLGGDALQPVSLVLTVLLGVPGCVAIAIGIVSIVWLPDRLLPRWYVRWRAGGRPLSELRR